MSKLKNEFRGLKRLSNVFGREGTDPDYAAGEYAGPKNYYTQFSSLEDGRNTTLHRFTRFRRFQLWGTISYRVRCRIAKSLGGSIRNCGNGGFTGINRIRHTAVGGDYRRW